MSGPSAMTVEVAARKFAVPFECVCCGEAPDAEMIAALPHARPKPMAREAAGGMLFPYCRRCVAHVLDWESAPLTSAGVMVIGILAALVVAIASRFLFGLVVFVLVLPIAYALASSRRKRAKAACAPSCASPGRAVTYLGGNPTARSFSFESLTYAARFAEQQSKLTAVTPKLRKLLDGHRIARLAVPTPAAPPMIVPPPLSGRDWIARVEAQSTTISRRNTLGRALEVVHEPGERQELLLAASRLELGPLLGRLEGLDGPAARQQVQRAIEELRADNVPDELEALELRQLEARLHQLT